VGGGVQLPKEAINLVVLPFADPLLGLQEDWVHYETVLRLFRFDNQTDGDAYLQAHHPVFYLKGYHNEPLALPAKPYASRAHPDNVREPKTLWAGFLRHGGRTSRGRVCH
jgi:hypothetical protein